MKELSPLKKVFCYYKSPLGIFTEWAINVVAKPDVEIPIEPGQQSVTIKCPCCVFWRGAIFGALIGLVVGAIL